MGGGLGSWIANRRWAEGGADQDYTLTGIAGGFGGAFTSPILGAFLVSELEPLPRHRYVASIIPQLIASAVGFMIFYSVVGRTFLGSYDVPSYEFEVIHMAIAAGLGILAAVVMMTFVGVVLAVKRVCKLVPNRYVLGVVGGAVVGLIAMALPLTVGAGQSQLGVVIDDATTLGIGLLIVVLLAKMVAMALSLEVGFMGGNVFPLIFMGGTAGTIVYLAFRNPHRPRCVMHARCGTWLIPASADQHGLHRCDRTCPRRRDDRTSGGRCPHLIPSCGRHPLRTIKEAKRGGRPRTLRSGNRIDLPA